MENRANPRSLQELLAMKQQDARAKSSPVGGKSRTPETQGLHGMRISGNRSRKNHIRLKYT